ncbi:MAG: bifunctional riboflavin kinase/FAD synthetase [Clostridia bacterium]|nr:bifunctional riboflavin kinase/FAD synthetase [Clostridia bacterium]
MLIYDITSSDKLPCEMPPCVVALGNFDGVHTGHTELLKQAVAVAVKRGLMPAVFTFAKHPETVLANRNAPSILTLDDKLEIFKELGIERVYLADFEKIRDYSPDRFVSDILRKTINASVAVCGFDFKFGQYGKGTPEMLTRLMDGEAVVIPPVMKRGQPVSSTLIRLAVESGDTEYAAQMLGRPFYIDFPVIHGKELGRSIGVPTINQNFPAGHVIPAHGVYACTVTIGQKKYAGVANVGSHPTVDTDAQINCETHIVGFTGWLYGQKIKVSFYKKIRDEKKFSSIDELVAQIERDIAQTKEYFDTGKIQ